MSEAYDFLSKIEPEPGELQLGPATVVGVKGLCPEVRLSDESVTVAQMALAFPYNFAKGDVVLVIGRGEDHYVIGVIQASGDVALRFQGNVNLHAVGGRLNLRGDEGVQVESPDFVVRVKKMTTYAATMVEKVGSLLQTVRERVDLVAGEKVERIKGANHVMADRASIATRGVVTINGKEVHLN